MNLLSIDIETWGLHEGYTLQPWQCKKGEAGIISIAFEDGTGEFVRPLSLYGFMCAPFVDFMTLRCGEDNNNYKVIKNNTLICGWNLKFDLAFLLATGHSYFRNFRYLDGMLLLKRLRQNLTTYSLKATLKDYAEFIPGYDPNYNDNIEFKAGYPEDAYSSEELDNMLKYNQKDASYTYFLIKHLIKKATPSELKQAIRESTLCLYFGESWANGINLDETVIMDLEKSLNGKLNKIESLLLDIGLNKKIINSTKQLPDYLINRLNVKLTDRTEKGALSVDKTTLKRLIPNQQGATKKVLKLILKYKSLETELNKFVKSAKCCYETYGRAHSDPMLNSTYTGRVTYSIHQRIKQEKKYKNGTVKYVNKQITVGIPIHQMKRGTMRDMVSAPRGYKILELDFCAQEMRLIACIAHEDKMIELFRDNKDLHAYTAAEIAGVSYDEFLKWKLTNPEKYKSLRFTGKLTNLSLQYRLSAKNLYKQWHDVYNIPDKEINDAIIARNAYLKIYHGIPKYWDMIIKYAKDRGYIMNIAGRKRFISGWGYEDSWKSEQTAINFPIQSGGAEQKILALFSLRKFIDEHSIKFAWDLHDGLYFYILESDTLYENISKMISIISNLDYKKAWGWIPQIEFPVEAKLGDRWGDLKVVNIE